MPSLRDLAAVVPPIRRLRDQRDQLAADNARLRAHVERGAQPDEDPAYRLYPPGHFYSPQPDLDEVRREADRIWPAEPDLPGIDLREAAQLSLLSSLGPELSWWPYYDDDLTGLRYRPDNDYFGHTDGQLLAALLRRHAPQRYVEIGCGWSSALVLDLVERDPAVNPDLVFVEPYPDRFRSLLRPGDLERLTLLADRAQDVDLDRLTSLGAEDLLVVDSTHVSKIGSDVNRLFFDVFPRLAPGVVVHVHDVIYPFEYGPDWIFEGRAWNEAYLLRALLVENPHWEILLWPSMLWRRHEGAMRAALGPRTKIDSASLWLRRR